MKTPRELLLERHRQMETKLDAVRQQVLAEHLQKAGTPNASWWVRLVRALTLTNPLSGLALFRPWPQLAALAVFGW